MKFLHSAVHSSSVSVSLTNWLNKVDTKPFKTLLKVEVPSNLETPKISWIIINGHLSLSGKCPNTNFFLVRIFPHSDWIQRDTKYLSVFSPNARKYGPEKPPYLDTFHAVCIILNYLNISACKELILTVFFLVSIGCGTMNVGL